VFLDVDVKRDLIVKREMKQSSETCRPWVHQKHVPKLQYSGCDALGMRLQGRFQTHYVEAAIISFAVATCNT